MARWVPITRSYLKMMPADRPYTKLEAAYVITADLQDGETRSANAYGKLFQWDHKRVQRFLATAEIVNLTSPTRAQEQSYGYDGLQDVAPSKNPGMLTKANTQQAPGERPVSAQEQYNVFRDLGCSAPGNHPENSQQKPSALIRGKKVEITSSNFSAFYSAYPKKKNRADAERAFAKLNPSAELFSKMMAALAWQTKQPDWVKDGGQYVPLPASWLNKRRWEDEKPLAQATRQRIELAI